MTTSIINRNGWSIEVVQDPQQEQAEIPKVTYRHPKSNTKMPYSLINKVKDSNNQLIEFTDHQRDLMNTIDGMFATGDNETSLDIFIRRFYGSETYQPDDPEREQFAVELAELSVIGGASFEYDDGDLMISTGMLVPIKVNFRLLKINGHIAEDTIKIFDYTCIHGKKDKQVEYWRLKPYSKYLKKNLINVSIARAVLDAFIAGEPVDIETLCDRLKIDDPDSRHDLTEKVIKSINYQRGTEQPEPKVIYSSERDGRGRPAISQIETK